MEMNCGACETSYERVRDILENEYRAYIVSDSNISDCTMRTNSIFCSLNAPLL